MLQLPELLRKDETVTAGRLASAFVSSLAADGNTALQTIVELAFWWRLPERIKSSSDLLFKPLALFGNSGRQSFSQSPNPFAAL
jgi:hypothetical protein